MFAASHQAAQILPSDRTRRVQPTLPRLARLDLAIWIDGSKGPDDAVAEYKSKACSTQNRLIRLASFHEVADDFVLQTVLSDEHWQCIGPCVVGVRILGHPRTGMVQEVEVDPVGPRHAVLGCAMGMQRLDGHQMDR